MYAQIYCFVACFWTSAQTVWPLQVVAEDAEFANVTTNLSVVTKHLPNFEPIRFSVCGQLDATDDLLNGQYQVSSSSRTLMSYDITIKSYTVILNFLRSWMIIASRYSFTSDWFFLWFTNGSFKHLTITCRGKYHPASYTSFVLFGLLVFIVTTSHLKALVDRLP